jgi:hypothetical protein
MAFDFTGFAAIPGTDDIRENVETAITWGVWNHNKAFIVPTILDGSIRDLGASPTTLLRPGLLLGQIRSTQKCVAWNSDNTDGSEEIFGVLLWDAVAQQLGVDKDRWFGFALIGGNIKASSLIVDGAASTAGIDGHVKEHYVRGVLSGRYVFDDNYHQWSGSPLMGGWKAIRTRAAAATTVLEADNGTLFTTVGSVAGNTFTLPAITNSMGQRYGFYCGADQNLTIASAAAGDLICLNNLTADSVTFSTAGHLIGSMFEVIGLDNASWLVIPHLADDGVIVTVA